MKSPVKPKKKKSAIPRTPLTARNVDARLRLLVKVTEGLARQGEELTRQGEELTRQSEELTRRAKEATRRAEEDARKAEADRDRLARLEEALAKDRENNENHRRNSSRMLEDAVAASLPRVMASEHDIVIRRRDVKVRASKGRQRLEYDFIAPNGEVVLVGEVKTRLGLDDVLKLAGALRHFRREFPQYAKLKIYGVVAGGAVDDKALAQALEEGFFVLRMDGAEAHPATEKGYQPTAY